MEVTAQPAIVPGEPRDADRECCKGQHSGRGWQRVHSVLCISKNQELQFHKPSPLVAVREDLTEQPSTCRGSASAPGRKFRYKHIHPHFVYCLFSIMLLPSSWFYGLYFLSWPVHFTTCQLTQSGPTSRELMDITCDVASTPSNTIHWG